MSSFHSEICEYIYIYIYIYIIKNFCYSLSRKKVSFIYGNLLLFQISIFQNRSFLSGQEFFQIEPDSVWSIPWVPRV